MLYALHTLNCEGLPWPRRDGVGPTPLVARETGLEVRNVYG